MNRNHIDLLVNETGLKFEEKGEIGFGRNCVGIVNQNTESYLSYQTYDEDYNPALNHEVASQTAPEDAYHKGPYLAVLYDGTEEGRLKAISQLNNWIEKIMAASYEVTGYTERNSLASLLAGGSVRQVCLTGGITYARFLEIF